MKQNKSFGKVIGSSIFNAFKKSQKNFFFHLIIALLITSSFYIYANNNKRFEVEFRIHISAHVYDHYEFAKDLYNQEVKTIIKDIMLADTSEFKKNHKLSFGTVTITNNRLTTIFFENLIHGFNLDKKKLENFFEETIVKTNKVYINNLSEKLENLKIASAKKSLRIKNEINYFIDNSKHINSSLDLNKYLDYSLPIKNEIDGLNLILLEDDHFTYSYHVISKQPQIILVSIFILIVTYLSSAITMGIYFAGKKLIND
jgi:hypothetical protein